MDNCIAAVDMGTNSFHLIIAKIKKDGSFKIIDREKEICRLGSHRGKGLSYITEEEKELAINILSRFKKLTEIYNAPLRAIATSAIREAENKLEFIENVRQNTGIEVEVIEGTEEAELIYRGVKNFMKVDDKKVLCVDIGGGSTEILLGDNGNTLFAGSVKVGAVRLSKRFFPDFILNRNSVDLCYKFIESKILSNKEINLKQKFDFAVGTSGTINAIALIIHSLHHTIPFKKPKKFKFDFPQLQIVNNLVLNAKTTAERLKIQGMEQRRADIIPAGVMILEKIFQLFKINEMRLSDYALREGIILDAIEQRSGKHSG